MRLLGHDPPPMSQADAARSGAADDRAQARAGNPPTAAAGPHAGARTGARARDRAVTDPLALAEPAIGFRRWRVEGETLVALGGERWPAGDVRAVCRTGSAHPAPEDGCGCGLYAWHEVPDDVEPNNYVLGAVVGWGRLLVHEDGFRAEYARPIALALRTPEQRGSRAPIAARYGLPVLDPAQLAAFAGEFGAAVPFAERPLDLVGRLSVVAGFVGRREMVQMSDDPYAGWRNRYSEHVLSLLVADPRRSLTDALRLAAEKPERLHVECNDWDAALRAFRRAVLDAPVSAESGTEPVFPLTSLLRALNQAHGLTVSRLTALLSSHIARSIPHYYALHRSVVAVEHRASVERARGLLAAEERWLPGGVAHAILAVLDELSDEDLRRHLARLRSSVDIAETLAGLGARAPVHARMLLAQSHPLCVHVCTEILGAAARPLLLRVLVRCPERFRYGCDDQLRRIVGDQALRLAADRDLRRAKDPVDTIAALTLLPGEEAREPLNRLLGRINRLRRREPRHRVYQRAWNVTCWDGLTPLLEPSLVEHALRDESLGLINHALILRALPHAAPVHAERIWTRPDISATFALDALRAAGGRRAELIGEALAESRAAIENSGAAGRLTAVLAETSPANPAAYRVATMVAPDRRFPATLRAVAAWVSRYQPPPGGDDAVMARYETWLVGSATLQDPLADLVTGDWLRRTLADGRN